MRAVAARPARRLLARRLLARRLLARRLLARRLLAVGAAAAILFTAACAGDGDSPSTPSEGATGGSETTAARKTLVVYSGRSQELVGDLLERFKAERGVDLQVRYGDSAELAATMLDEGDRSPADVFFSQDAGALGALAEEDRLEPIPAGVLEKVAAPYRDPEGHWMGISARSRVLVHDPQRTPEAQLPASVLDLTAPRWKGKVGWAPPNASFQAFVTGLRLLRGEHVAKRWLAGMVANAAKPYPNNVAIVQAVAAGEIDVGLVNHYYVLELKRQQPELRAANHFLGGEDPGALVNVAGVGLLKTAEHRDVALQLVDFLLSAEGQTYFRDKTFEYPLSAGVAPDPTLRPLGELASPKVDLSALADLRKTLELLSETGVT